MKIKLKITLVLLISLILLFSLSVNAISSYEFVENTESKTNNKIEPCYHGTLYDFDDKTMTVNGVYEGNHYHSKNDENHPKRIIGMGY